MIKHIQAYSLSKHYGQELNDHIKCLPHDCWVAVRDMDTMLFDGAVELMYEAIESHPNIDLFTCATNRAWRREMSTEPDIVKHAEIAQRRALNRSYTRISGVVPAFFWLFPHKVWRKTPFDEHPILWPPKRPNSFDVRWSRQIRNKMRIDHLYVFHMYRLHKQSQGFSHLV